MIFRSPRFRKSLAGLLLLLAVPPCFAEPTADNILQATRMNPLGQNVALDAQLRTGPVKTPFQIVVDGSVHFRFQNPTQELVLVLDDKAPRLVEHASGKTATVRPARFDQPVRASALTYEDLALRFLYWKNAKIAAEETIRTRPSWKIEVQAPDGASQYAMARMWIDKESGALLRMEGYDAQGKLIRRFEVVSAQKLDGQWMLKQMRVEALDPASGKVTLRTYLEVLGRSQTQ